MERYRQIGRAFKQAPWRLQLQAAAAASLVLVAVVAIGGMYLASASRWATTGREVQELERRKQTLLIENGELRRELSRLRSAARLSARAAELGYGPASVEQIEYLVVAGYPGRDVASAPAPTPAPSDAMTVGDAARYDETLLDWISRLFSNRRAEAAEG